MDADLRAAVYGAKDIGANTGDAAVDSAYRAEYAAPIASGAITGASQMAQTAIAEQEKAAAAARAAEEAKTDPKNFQRLPKSDGGFAFFDPTGKEISAHDYARATNTSVASVLADSENPIDISFVNDYRNLQDYMEAWQNNDTKKIEAIRSQSEELKKIDSPHELMRRFYQAYPTVYGQGGFRGPRTAGQKVGTSFVPRYQSDEAGGYNISSDNGIGS